MLVDISALDFLEANVINILKDLGSLLIYVNETCLTVFDRMKTFKELYFLKKKQLSDFPFSSV